jgi:Flp pilus assembly protein TadB
MDNVMTWWGSNQWAKDAVRRTLSGGRSGRIAVFGIAAAFLAVGIYGGSLLLSVASGIAIVAAAGALVRAARDNRAARRMERRYHDSPDGRSDQPASSGSAVPDP